MTALRASTVAFVSLGGVWLDEIIRPGRPDCKDVVGGSATYATLGVRFFMPKQPERIVLIVNAGFDFPDTVLDALRRWRVSLTTIVQGSQRSTRGILEHLASGGSKFTRLTPPLLTSPPDVRDAGALPSEVFHLFAAPALGQSQALELVQARIAVDIAKEPIIIWEPHPKSCVPELLGEHLAVLRSSPIAVFSPNHHELNAFFDGDHHHTAFDKIAVETRARRFLQGEDDNCVEDTASSARSQAVVVRAAEHGCLVVTRNPSRAVWLPAYWTQANQERVIDPTGAGNAFLGGLAAGWLETQDWLHAASYGAVAAGIVVEHVGPPEPSYVSDSTALDSEHWGQAYPRQRLKRYQSRACVVEAMGAGQTV